MKSCTCDNCEISVYQCQRHGYERVKAERDGLAAALESLLANSPKPKNVKTDYHYMVHLEAARTALAKLEGESK